MADQVLEDYKRNIIKKNPTPQVYYLKNPELETVGIIENGYLYMGYAYFEHQEFNSEQQAIDFAKELGASLILIHTEYKRTKKVYGEVATSFPISTTPVLVEQKRSIHQVTHRSITRLILMIMERE